MRNDIIFKVTVGGIDYKYNIRSKNIRTMINNCSWKDCTDEIEFIARFGKNQPLVIFKGRFDYSRPLNQFIIRPYTPK